MEYMRLIRQVLQLSLHRGYSVALLTNQSIQNSLIEAMEGTARFLGS